MVVYTFTCFIMVVYEDGELSTFPSTCWDVDMKNTRVCWIPSSSHGERSLANWLLWLIHSDWINGWSTVRRRAIDEPSTLLEPHWNLDMENTHVCRNPPSSHREPFLSSCWARDVFCPVSYGSFWSTGVWRFIDAPSTSFWHKHVELDTEMSKGAKLFGIDPVVAENEASFGSKNPSIPGDVCSEGKKGVFCLSQNPRSLFGRTTWLWANMCALQIIGIDLDFF